MEQKALTIAKDICCLKCYICNMDALIVYPENNEQLTALKAVMKAMKISFEQKSDIYPQQVLEGIKTSLKQAEAGELKPYKSISDMLDKK